MTWCKNGIQNEVNGSHSVITKHCLNFERKNGEKRDFKDAKLFLIQII